MKFVCWFAIGTKIENVRLNVKNPFYDCFIYHGTLEEFNLPSNTKVNISVDLIDKEN
jgi:hypothetical protein